jgi:hypothetical protein
MSGYSKKGEGHECLDQDLLSCRSLLCFFRSKGRALRLGFHFVIPSKATLPMPLEEEICKNVEMDPCMHHYGNIAVVVSRVSKILSRENYPILLTAMSWFITPMPVIHLPHTYEARTN